VINTNLPPILHRF